MSARNIESSDTGTLATRIDGLERDVDILGKRFEKGFSDLSNAIRGISERLAAAPTFDVAKILYVILACVGLIGSGSAAVVFVSTSITAGPLAELRTRVEYERETTRKLENMVRQLVDMKLAGK